MTRVIFSQIVNTVLSIVLFAIIPFGVYWVRKRKFSGLLNHLGVYFPKEWNWKPALGWLSLVYLSTLVLRTYLKIITEAL